MTFNRHRLHLEVNQLLIWREEGKTPLTEPSFIPMAQSTSRNSRPSGINGRWRAHSSRTTIVRSSYRMNSPKRIALPETFVNFIHAILKRPKPSSSSQASVSRTPSPASRKTWRMHAPSHDVRNTTFLSCSGRLFFLFAMYSFYTFAFSPISLSGR